MCSVLPLKASLGGEGDLLRVPALLSSPKVGMGTDSGRGACAKAGHAKASPRHPLCDIGKEGLPVLGGREYFLARLATAFCTCTLPVANILPLAERLCSSAWSRPGLQGTESACQGTSSRPNKEGEAFLATAGMREASIRASTSSGASPLKRPLLSDCGKKIQEYDLYCIKQSPPDSEGPSEQTKR